VSHEIRPATPLDRDAFIRLWQELLKEREGFGSYIDANARSLQFYLALFDHYVSRPDGLVLVVGDGQGVLMWGVVPLPFAHHLGRFMQGWGVYLEPPLRRKGLGRELYRVGLKALHERGFDGLLGTFQPTNRAVVMLAEEFGAKVLEHTVWVPARP
jgi:GNAT superfamily N-acetyltransferase